MSNNPPEQTQTTDPAGDWGKSILSETFYGVDIFYRPFDQSYTCVCEVWDSEICKMEKIGGYNSLEVKERLKDILLQNFYNTLETLSNNIGETKKRYNDPVEHYGNVIDAIYQNPKLLE